MNTSLPTPSIRITELRLLAYLFMIGMAVGPSTHADIPILQSHCSECHSDASAEGEFRLSELGDQPADDNLGRWFQVLERVRAGEMPPTDAGHVTDREQEKLLRFLRDSLNAFRQQENHSSHIRPRRLNNREFQNSVRDVLLIDDHRYESTDSQSAWRLLTSRLRYSWRHAGIQQVSSGTIHHRSPKDCRRYNSVRSAASTEPYRCSARENIWPNISNRT